MEITLQQVWQTQNEIEPLNIDHIFDELKSAGAKVKEHSLPMQSYRCYADVLSQAVITHDGKVFKCTARDFASENPDGYLQEDGSIDWTKIYFRRISQTTAEVFEKCRDCLFLPACFGPCSQKILEYHSEDSFKKICNYGGYDKTVEELLRKYYLKILQNENN